VSTLRASLLRSVSPEARERLSSAREFAPVAVQVVAEHHAPDLVVDHSPELASPVAAEHSSSSDVARRHVDVAPDDVRSRRASSRVQDEPSAERPTAEEVTRLARFAMGERLPLTVDTGRGPLLVLLDLEMTARRPPKTAHFRGRSRVGPFHFRADEVLRLAVDTEAPARARAQVLALAIGHAPLVVHVIDGRCIVGRMASGSESTIPLDRFTLLGRDDRPLATIRYGEVISVREVLT